jgi:hypothetical protein
LLCVYSCEFLIRIKIMNVSIISQTSLMPLNNLPLLPLHTISQLPVIKVSTYFIEFDITKIICHILFCLASLTQHNYFKIHLHGCMYQEFISTGGMAQMVDQPPSKCKSLSSNPSMGKKKKKNPPK